MAFQNAQIFELEQRIPREKDEPLHFKTWIYIVALQKQDLRASVENKSKRLERSLKTSNLPPKRHTTVHLSECGQPL
jgi:hypothetical protein